MPRSFVVLTLAIGGLLALWGALGVLDRLVREAGRETRPLPVGAEVRVETGSGDLEVVAATGPPRIELRTVSGLWGAPQVEVRRRSDGVVSVRAECSGPLTFSCSAEARLLVPARSAVTAETGSGGVTVRGIRGGVVAETGSGDVALTGVGGDRVSADTGSGSISATGIAASLLRATTGSGDVGAELLAPPREVVVDTGSGSVDLRVPDAGYAVETDTGSGDERVDVRRDDTAPRRIRVETGSGDVSVRPAR